MLHFLLDPQAWVGLVTLVALELVLGVDNILFIAILVEKLPSAQRETGRRVGLLLALFLRVALLLGLSWVVGLTKPLLSLAGIDFSGRMLILAGGGLFLVWKSATEIRGLFDGQGDNGGPNARPPLSLLSAIMQVTLIDLVFSLDSIVTAIGMVDQVPIMIAAIVISVGLMMAFAGGIGRFIAAHPTIKMLALAFLLSVGAVLIAEGCGLEVPKGYLYAAMGFSLLVELCNIRLRRKVDAADATDAASRIAQRHERGQQGERVPRAVTRQR